MGRGAPPSTSKARFISAFGKSYYALAWKVAIAEIPESPVAMNNRIRDQSGRSSFRRLLDREHAKRSGGAGTYFYALAYCTQGLGGIISKEYFDPSTVTSLHCLYKQESFMV